MDGADIIIGWRAALIFAVCLPVFISAIILLFRRSEKRANRFLALALLAAVWAMGPQIIGFANGYSVWPGLTFFPFNTEMLIAPLIYLHAFTLMKTSKLGWRKFLLLPGVIALLYYLCAFLTLGDYQNKWAYSREVHTPYVYPIILAMTVFLASLCFVFTIRLIRQYRSFLLQTQSAAKDFDPIWLIWMFGLLGFAGLTWMCLGVISLVNPGISYVAAYPFQLISMIAFAAIGFLAISRINEIFPKINNTVSTALSNFKEKDWEAEGLSLFKTVKSEKWYLEPRLSIRDVASRMRTNETYISRALNKGLGQSFNRFINELRIDHAKAEIQTGKQSFLTIALDSGFNSKATFNRVFRDIVGKTPSAFKKSV
jgi:AraC-like DNA-binding protein